MKKLISLLIALLIGALASWITPKAPVTPQNAGFEAITAEVEEQPPKKKSPQKRLWRKLKQRPNKLNRQRF